MAIKTSLLRFKRVGIKSVSSMLLFPTRVLRAPDVNKVTKFPLIMGAHRGDSKGHTENTKSAIKGALENPKYRFIEFDVQMTKDKKVIILHNEPLIRIRRRQSSAYRYTYKEINEIYGYHIPTLGEVLKLIRNKKKIDIDMKSIGNIKGDQELVDLVVKECIKYNVTKSVLISSMNPRILKYIAKNYPNIKRGLIVDKLRTGLAGFIPSERSIRHFYSLADKVGAEYIMLHGITLNNYKRIMKLKPSNITLVFWYFNDQMFIMQKDRSDRLW